MAEKFTRVFLTDDQESGIEIFVSEHDSLPIEKYIAALTAFFQLKNTFQAHVFDKITDEPEIRLLVSQISKPLAPETYAIEMESIPDVISRNLNG